MMAAYSMLCIAMLCVAGIIQATEGAEVCTGGAVWTDCGSMCWTNCSRRVLPGYCDEECYSGCLCPDDKVMHEQMCITHEQCPDLPPCHHELAYTRVGLPGAFVPSCEEDGYYSLHQCHGSIGECWCSTRNGTEIPTTRTGRGETPHDCQTDLPPCHYELGMTYARVGMPGAFVPSCEENGYYSLHQCYDSIGACWCSIRDGTEIPTTRTGPGETPHDCQTDLPPCHGELLGLPEPMPGLFIPTCDEYGHYSARQCHGSTGHCWCSTRDGTELENTRTGPGETRVECQTDLPPCHKMMNETELMPGTFVPTCDEEGYFSSHQCHGSTGQCWCSTKDGREYPDTRSRPGPQLDTCDNMQRLSICYECVHGGDDKTCPEPVDGVTNTVVCNGSCITEVGRTDGLKTLRRGCGSEACSSIDVNDDVTCCDQDHVCNAHKVELTISAGGQQKGTLLVYCAPIILLCWLFQHPVF